MSGRYSTEVFAEPRWLILWDKKSPFPLYSTGHIKYGKSPTNFHATQSSHAHWLLMKVQLLSSQESAVIYFGAESCLHDPSAYFRSRGKLKLSCNLFVHHFPKKATGCHFSLPYTPRDFSF